jgi:hypothetical protein
MATTGRLQQQCPDLASIVEGLAEAERGPRMRQVVESVAATTGVVDECRSASDLAGLVSRLDDEAWTLQANESSTDYERALHNVRSACHVGSPTPTTRIPRYVCVLDVLE